MSNIARKFRTSKEATYGLLMLIFGIPLWFMFLVGIIAALASPEASTIAAVYLFYGIAIALFYFISGLAYRATAFGNMMLLSPEQFPELHAMVVAGSKELGFEEPPKTFLFNSNGMFNAFARRVFAGRFVFLTSALVDASSDEQVKFVIGHELGHHAAGHLNGWMNLLKFPGHVVPFLGSAYSRSREYTCDKIGAHLSNDLAASRSALQMLGCGCRRLNQTMNCEAFIAQEAMVPPVFGFITEIFRSHPRLTRRVKSIRDTIATS